MTLHKQVTRMGQECVLLSKEATFASKAKLNSLRTNVPAIYLQETSALLLVRLVLY